MRSIWKGILSFGLVTIPVDLCPSVRKKTISFNQLHKADYSRIRYKKVADGGGEEVSSENIVRGFEVTPGNYVVISDEDLAAIEPKSSRNIEIKEFVHMEQIDSRYFDASYYLVPQIQTAKAYALLLESMRQAGVVGIAKLVLRSKEYLAAVRPTDGIFTLSTLLFHDEVIETEELAASVPDVVTLPEKELAMARQLIDSLTEDFVPEKYNNEYYEQVMALIDRKAASQQVAGQSRAPGKVLDIMAALEASLAANKRKVTSKAKRKKASGD
jgi:DNA end-binding protein Ku